LLWGEVLSIMKAKANAEYIAMQKSSIEDVKAGRVVVKTLDELRAMEESISDVNDGDPP